MALLIPALRFDATLIGNPRALQLPEPDRIQYLSGDPSGYGRAEIAAVLLSERSSGRRVNALVHGSWEQIAAYLGPRVGTVWGFRDLPEQRSNLAAWLADGEAVFYVEGDATAQEPLALHGARLEPAGSFRSGSGMLRLYRVVGANGTLAEEVYARLAPDPHRLEADYAALAAGSDGVPVAIFPANQAETLSRHTNGPVLALAPESWPLEADQIAGALDALALTNNRLLNLVLVDEARSDPNRVVLLTFERRFYRLEEAWFGLLHQIRYANGPVDPSMQPVGGQFEGAIELTEAVLLDQHAYPGQVIRFALCWRSSVPVADSFVVFTHIVGVDGKLWAQHDSVPGNGLLPMTGWQANQVVTDRFAIRLPPDIPPGSYQVRIGLYHPDSKLRLRVTDGVEVGPDFVVIEQLIVVP